MKRRLVAVFALAPLACGDDTRATAGASDSATTMPTTATTPTTEATGTSTTTTTSPTTSEGTTTEDPVVPTSTSTTAPSTTTTGTTGPGATGPGTTTDATTGEPIDVCKVQDDMDAVGECDQEAPPDSFDPELQWTWTGPNGDAYSIVTPLVANVTDDNADGVIDLCDTPDIVVVASPYSGSVGQTGRVYVLDGATGAQHAVFATSVDHTVTPAIGDIDGDGLPEIVTSVVGGNPIAFEHDGAHKWTSASGWPEVYSGSIALGDVDNDGDVEILAGNRLFDHNGVLLVTLNQPAGNWSSSALADLDGDGDLEIVLGHAAFQHTGEALFVSAVAPGYPSIADLDGDGLPEVLVTNMNGLSLLNHDGSIIFQDQQPTGDPPFNTNWLRPSTVHDFDGDGESEFAVSSANNYTVYRPQGPTILWKAPVSDFSGIAAGTAFDFLGDGVAEAMYADEQTMFIFGGAGEVLLQIPRSSGTLSEYPVVADVDNDGQADIVVVSNAYGKNDPNITCVEDNVNGQSGVRVFGTAGGKWVRTRRVWNQHTYHITNVNEDGTIPAGEEPNWTVPGFNNFRQNKQPGSEFGAPDAIVAIAPLCEDEDYSLAATVRNIGEAALPAGVVVGFYTGEPGSGTKVGELVTSKALYPLESETLTLPFNDAPEDVKNGVVAIYAVVDDTMVPHPEWQECRTDNNTGTSSGKCLIAG
ncbi:FG-GAP repeat domain-containing protein [Nannocystis pusilla]|uniref:FG-GAP-like repeat-containing protein n=1 Tax=Nannocystis pusilla TaxID=889268 RepID=A0ABS7U058_9BACT|nr:FG-GAP-like repeat-containing protein [Nannocystis pusilla]MBZ5713755.1 FG-GAP-like repeat-containing protein [Nannocystis pusilla]